MIDTKECGLEFQFTVGIIEMIDILWKI